jgi:hypothetical protein
LFEYHCKNKKKIERILQVATVNLFSIRFHMDALSMLISPLTLHSVSQSILHPCLWIIRNKRCTCKSTKEIASFLQVASWFDFLLTQVFGVLLLFLHRYVNGHDCVGHKSRQPTYVLTSMDGVEWELPPLARSSSSAAASTQQENGLIFNDIFYLTAPIKLNDGWFYAICKTQEDSVGSTILCRSRSLVGPYEHGPLRAKGM